MRSTVPIVHLVIIVTAIAFMALLPALADDVPVAFFKKSYADYHANDRQSFAMQTQSSVGQPKTNIASMHICH